MTEPWWPYGRVGRPHGIRGSVHVHLENPESELLREGLRVQLQLPSGSTLETHVAECFGPGRVRFACAEERDGAAELRGALIRVSRADFPPPPDDEAYLVDLIGARVLHEEGRELGTIESFDVGGPQILAVAIVPVEGGERRVEFPFVPGLVIAVDEHAGTVRVRPPWGLFEGEPDEVSP